MAITPQQNKIKFRNEYKIFENIEQKSLESLAEKMKIKSLEGMQYYMIKKYLL